MKGSVGGKPSSPLSARIHRKKRPKEETAEREETRKRKMGKEEQRYQRVPRTKGERLEAGTRARNVPLSRGVTEVKLKLQPRTRRQPRTTDRSGRKEIRGSFSRGACFGCHVVTSLTPLCVAPGRGEFFLFRETLLIITGHESWDMYGSPEPEG